MKKLILAVLVVGTFLSQNAFAANSFKDVPSTASYAEAVNGLSELGVITGDDKGNFNPNKTITRAEAAVIICKVKGVAEEAAKLNKSSFADVPSSHWAVGYIAKANELGIISGYNKDKFGPNDSVTYEQFIKMLVCAYNLDDVAKEEGGWPDGYIKVADTLGITDNINVVNKNSAVRSDVAMLVYNAMY